MIKEILKGLVGFILAFFVFLLIVFDGISIYSLINNKIAVEGRWLVYLIFFLTIVSILVFNWIGRKLIKGFLSFYNKKIPATKHENGYFHTGFCKRALAGMIDFLILSPITIPMLFQYSSKMVFLVNRIGGLLILYGYTILFLIFRGQTIGKILTHIKVTKIDGTKVGFKEAILRSSVDLTFSIVLLVGTIISLYSIPNQEFNNLTFQNGLKIMHMHRVIPNWFMIVQDIWIFADFIVLVSNRQRRSIHDFIAGTVVLSIDQIASPCETEQCDNTGDLEATQTDIVTPCP